MSELSKIVGECREDVLATVLQHTSGDVNVAANILLDGDALWSSCSHPSASRSAPVLVEDLDTAAQPKPVPVASLTTVSGTCKSGDCATVDLTLQPTSFSTGSIGWTLSQTSAIQVGSTMVTARITCNAVVVGSKPGAKRPCRITPGEFSRIAKPWKLKLDARPREFQSGNSGWSCSQRIKHNVDGVDVPVALNLNIVAQSTLAVGSEALQCGRDNQVGKPQHQRGRREDGAPMYWSLRTLDGHFLAQGWSVEPVSSEELLPLSECLVTQEAFGGYDHKGIVDYTSLVFVCAWRLENPSLWGKYQFARGQVRFDLNAVGHRRAGNLQTRQALLTATSKLPGKMDSSINEVYALHGTSPAVLLSVMQNGINERYSGCCAGAMFGDGCYLCEDAAKADQYVVPDPNFNQNSELHKRLFTACRIRHDGDLCFVFVVRTIMGAFATTQDGRYMQNSPGEHVFAQQGANRRELANVPGTDPPVTYHGLLVNTGHKHSRFREFVQFHGDRCYPEYLIAFRRV
jgi:hypothetical protein